ncbi:MAG: peptidoglycan DD-metalloendopeptidase family protein, partial [Actinomycetota bacterium]|nr:peptidoglycan DD-metalloendopeptidase family protein [Actinomycetota bacterium]
MPRPPVSLSVPMLFALLGAAPLAFGADPVALAAPARTTPPGPTSPRALVAGAGSEPRALAETAQAAGPDVDSPRGAPRSDSPSVDYEPPLAGRVVAAFDPPAQRWGAGHRGVDLAAVEGEAVRAAADGVVSFAGSIAGQAWVSLDHPDGVRTSYGPLGRVDVASGQRVRRGDGLGTVLGGHRPAAVALHWGARRGGDYLDPLSLLKVDSWRPALSGPGRQLVTDLPEVPHYGPWRGRRGLGGALGLVEGSPIAHGPGWLLPPNPNHVVAIAGLGSRSGTVPIDLTHLGFQSSAITELSYEGRHDRGGDPRDPHRDQLPYGPPDTWDGVRSAALQLRDELRALQARSPGQAVDLVGHSMGGVVALTYLLTLHDPADPTLPPVAHVVTIGSPLEGADLARAVTAASKSTLSRGVLAGVAAGTGLPGPHEQTVQDLAVGSPLVGELAAAWTVARDARWSGPLATGTQVLTLGGSRD